MIAVVSNIAIHQILSHAKSLHQKRDFRAAAAGYEQVLRLDRENAEAFHLLGLLRAECGDLQGAAKFLSEAARIQPRIVDYQGKLGTAFQLLLDPARARICFGRVTQLQLPPGHTADYLAMSLDQVQQTPPEPSTPRTLYLDLLRRCLLNLIYQDGAFTVDRQAPFDPARRQFGIDWPDKAHTMIGATRLENLQRCIEDVLARNVPGDLLEAGVWRGGATILMRGVLKAHDVSNRNVWVADSFKGVPPADASRYPQDAGLTFADFPQLAISLDQVKENFRRYELLDEHVRFLEGLFKDTLPTAPIERLAVMRLDGDLYESTMDGLKALYPKLSPGGYVIIDDFVNIEAVRLATLDYRRAMNITAEIQPVDWSAVYWRRH